MFNYELKFKYKKRTKCSGKTHKQKKKECQKILKKGNGSCGD